MQFEGNHKGVLMSWGTKATKGEGVEVTTAKVEIKMDQEALAQAVSSEFAAAMFAFLVDDDEQGLLWTTDPLTPKGTYPAHTLKLAGTKGREVQPRIAKIRPVKGEAAVEVDLELPFPLNDAELAGKLHMKVGSQVTVDLEVRQLEMPSSVVKASGKFGNPKHVAAGAEEEA